MSETDALIKELMDLSDVYPNPMPFLEDRLCVLSVQTLRQIIAKLEPAQTPAIDDAAVERALAAWYPEEWPDDKCFQKVFSGETMAARSRREMRAALLAAFEQPK